MEEWEREHIRKHLPELTTQTRFTQALLDKLKAQGVIGDWTLTNWEGLSEYTRVSDLYDLLRTKVNGFQGLAKALFADNQSGAHRILLMEKFSDKNFSGYSDKPKIFLFHAYQNIKAGKCSEMCKGMTMDPRHVLPNAIYFTPFFPGMEAKRHPQKGAYFVQTFCKINAYGDKEDLKSMAKLMQSKLKTTRVSRI